MSKLLFAIIGFFVICLSNLNAASIFEYDSLSRLSVVNHLSSVRTMFQFDSSGNRTRKITRYAPIVAASALPDGQYLGAVEFPSDELAHARVLVNISRTGSFTASIEMGGRRVQWKGVFTQNGSGGGTWVGTLNDAVLGVLELRLELPPGGGQMTVFITQNDQTNTGLLALAGQRVGGNVSAGLYTVLLPANPDFPEDDYPQGDGYATLRVTAKGQARLAGKLGDGTTMTQSGPLTHDGRFQVFVPLYKKAGVLSGWVDFTPIAQISDFNGTLHWTKPESPSALFYPAGFDLALDILGSKFAPPLTGRRILNFNFTDGRSVLGFSRGNLSELILKETVLSTQHKLMISNPGEESARLAFTTSSGLFSGSFIHPGAQKRTPFAGVVLQKQNIASGHFLNTNRSGLVTLQKDLFSGLVIPSAQTTEPDNEVKTPPLPAELVFQLANEFNYYDSAWPENGYPNPVYSEVPIPGKFEDTADGLLFRASRPRGGGAILTKGLHTLAGQTLEYMWDGSGAGAFMQPVCGFTPNQWESEWTIDNSFIVCEFNNTYASWLASPGIVYRTTVTFTETSATLVTTEAVSGAERDRKTRSGNFTVPLRPFFRGGDTQNPSDAFLRLRTLSIRPTLAQ